MWHQAVAALPLLVGLELAEPRAEAVSFAVHLPRASDARRLAADTRYAVADLGVAPHILEVRLPATRAAAAAGSTGALFEEAYRLGRELGARRAEPLFDLQGAPAATRWGLFEEGTHDARAAADPLWSLKHVRAEAAWQKVRAARQRGPGAEAQGIAIAHPDTGYRDHPEIWDGDPARRAVWADVGYDYFGEDRDATDELFIDRPLDNPAHGTGSGSAIVSPDGCQLAGAARCPTGIARGARLVPLRVHRSVVHFDTSRLARAIADASGPDRSRVGAPTHLMSISMGGVPSWTLWQAVRTAEQRGYLIIAAAGNYVGTVVWPARFPSTIAVAATNVGCRPWAHTSAGSAVDVSAPGESVWRAMLDGARRPITSMGIGTTYATATVAGVAALWMARHEGSPELAALRQRGALTAAFRDLLRQTAWTPAHPPPGITCDGPSWNAGDMGAGIVDAARLLDAPLPAAAPRSAERADVDELPLFSSLYAPGTPVEVVRAAYDALFPGHARPPAAGETDRFEAEVLHHYALDRGVAAALDAVAVRRDESPSALERVRAALLARDLSPSLRAALRP